MTTLTDLWNTIAWGTLPDWVNLILTGIALCAAWKAYSEAIRQRKLSSKPVLLPLHQEFRAFQNSGLFGERFLFSDPPELQGDREVGERKVLRSPSLEIGIVNIGAHAALEVEVRLFTPIQELLESYSKYDSDFPAITVSENALHFEWESGTKWDCHMGNGGVGVTSALAIMPNHVNNHDLKVELPRYFIALAAWTSVSLASRRKLRFYDVITSIPLTINYRDIDENKYEGQFVLDFVLNILLPHPKYFPKTPESDDHEVFGGVVVVRKASGNRAVKK